MTTRILVSLLTGKREDIDLARRRLAYRRLVLLAHPGSKKLAEAVRASEEGDAPTDAVRVEAIEGGRVDEHVARIQAILAEERAAVHDAVFVLNAAGGDPALVMAMLLVAYEAGHETYFTQEGHHVRLPVLWGVRLEDRFEADEETVLARLEAAGASSVELAQRLVLPRERIERAYRGLERKGAVSLFVTDGRVAARPTQLGAYVQGHLGR